MSIFSTYNLWENIPPLFNTINEMLYHVHTQLSLHKKRIHQLNWICFMSSAFFVLRFVFCLLHSADNIFCNYSKSSKLVWCGSLNNYLKRPKLFNCQSAINIGIFKCLVHFTNDEHANMLDFFVDSVNLCKHCFDFP